MRVSVTLMRFRGVPLDRSKLRDQEEQVRGDLRVEEKPDELLGRTVRFARLAGLLPKDEEVVRPLNDVQLLWMGTEAFVLSGLERIDGADYAQGWLCRTR